MSDCLRPKKLTFEQEISLSFKPYKSASAYELDMAAHEYLAKCDAYNSQAKQRFAVDKKDINRDDDN